MGIINIVKTIKEIHKYDIVIVEIGKFYQIYGRDSYIISYLFGYKLKEIEGISMCGFPVNSINKVIAKLEEKKINYIIVDRRNNYTVTESLENKNLNNYEKYFEESKKYVNYKKRIENINNYMIENLEKKDFKKVLIKMEEIINERRKVQDN